ncbi:hypothetical protein [Bacillus bombysepticus]|uniref:hypothetical protein n=1 Tax=Bacillus bombysepticus TaxID=658666 RepID=UPI00301863C9
MALTFNNNELKVIGVIGFVQMSIFDSLGYIPKSMLQFKFNEDDIIDPTVTACAYFRRDPIVDYGESFLKSNFVTFIKKYNILDSISFEELSLVTAKIIGDLQDIIFLETKDSDCLLTVRHVGKEIINPFRMYISKDKEVEIDPVEHFGSAYLDSYFLKVINKALVTKNEYR